MVNVNEPVVLQCTDGKSVNTCLGVIWQFSAYRAIYRRQGCGKKIAASVNSDVASVMCNLLEPYKNSSYRPRNDAKLRAVPMPVQEPLALELKNLTNNMFEIVFHSAAQFGCFRLRDACVLRINDACYGQNIETVKDILQLDANLCPRRGVHGDASSSNC